MAEVCYINPYIFMLLSREWGEEERHCSLMSTRWPWLSWLYAFVITWLIAWCGCLVVNPYDPFMAVNPHELHIPIHCCLPVYTARTWWLSQRSICNIHTHTPIDSVYTILVKDCRTFVFHDLMFFFLGFLVVFCIILRRIFLQILLVFE